MNKPLILAYSKQAGGAEKSAIKLFNGFVDIEGIFPVFGTLVRSSKDFYHVKNSSSEMNLLPLCNFLIAKEVPLRWIWLPFVAPLDLLHFRLKIKWHGINSVVSFGAGVGCVAFLALIGTRTRQVTSERIDPNPEVYKPSRLTSLMRPFIYRHGVVCSVQTNGVLMWVKKNWGIKAVLTPNHFEIPTNRWANQDPDGPVVAVGRPAFQKGYDLLLSAWKQVEEFEKRELWIICDDREDFVKSLIRRSGCRNVRVKPLTDNLYELYDQASMYISTARFEGYPNAIAEAIIYGIPVMTTVSSDIVLDWSEAQLCISIDDVSPEVLSEQIMSVMNDRETQQRVSNNGVSNRGLFEWRCVKDAWLSTLS
jgi:GalNAc-alpha-(1->4)-GalNAc-alpha-(1->3)-diNAcBac-PP-undecaprenol alpha-1,4-N-acetyl-D-galactosaminyltransferase